MGPGAIDRIWASYGAEVSLDPGLPDTARRLLCDPQTSGGLPSLSGMRGETLMTVIVKVPATFIDRDDGSANAMIMRTARPEAARLSALELVKKGTK